MRASAASLSASKRITTTGVVFDERASPKPSGYSTRKPSIFTTSSAPVNWALFCRRAINSKFSPSSSLSCSSGVECELAVRLGHRLPPGPCTFAQAALAVDELFTAIEIVENRYGDLAELGTPMLIADQMIVLIRSPFPPTMKFAILLDLGAYYCTRALAILRGGRRPTAGR